MLKLVADSYDAMTCRKCGEHKPATSFCSGKSRVCKACHAEYQRSYVARNRERVNAAKREYARENPHVKAEWVARNRDHVRDYQSQYNREYHRKNWVRKALDAARKRACEKGVPFDLAPGDVFVPEFCPVLGIRIEVTSGRGGFQHSSPSIDRIIPELGYVRGNIAVISMRANKLKSDATSEELERISAWMRSVGAK